MDFGRAAAVVAFGLLCGAFGSPTAAEQSAPVEPAAPGLRIPDGARPTHYAVTLTVIPGEASAPGEITIDVELDRPHAVLWLNADAIAVSHAVTESPDEHVRILAGHDQFIGLAFDRPLSAGMHRLTLTFEAEQSRNSVRGVFTLQEAGAWYSMTQFEPVSARKAFPCFDEPVFKAPWQVVLRVPRQMQAVSNTPIVAETAIANDLKLVRFAETQPLPSYLVGFAVGPWDITDLGRVGMQPTPMRLIAPRGRAPALAFAAQAFPQLFAQEERWFGIAYPFAKLDQIAIPLTVRFAMENAGLITYGAPILLEPGAATPSFRHGSASVGAHEMAHQWFGNLVTAAWWDDIWLNEAFATWFAEKMVDAWRPAYERGAQRVHERAEAIEEDTLASARTIRQPIVSRGDIFNAFDSITYQKGATVIGMFEGWVGEEAFRRGARRYLEQHRYGNATVHDFLDALTVASGRPLAAAFSTFLDQNGVPEVDVELQCSAQGSRLALAQHRHVPFGSAAIGGAPNGAPAQSQTSAGASAAAAQRWQIPVCVRYGAGDFSSNVCTLLADATATLELRGRCPAYVFANAGGRGYYIPNYRGGLLARLERQRNVLTAAELASLLYDLRALVESGSLTGAQALDWIRTSARSNDRHVTAAAIELATFVRDRLVTDDDRTHFAAFVRHTLSARARALGFAPRRGEGDDDQLVRRTVLRFAAPEDPRLAAEARRLALAWLGDRKAVDPGLADTVLLVAARTGDRNLFDAMVHEANVTTAPVDRRNLLVGLFSFADRALAHHALELLLDPDLDIRETTTALSIAHGLYPAQRDAHDFIVTHFDALTKRVDRDAPTGWSGYARGLCSADDRAAVDSFWRDRLAQYSGAERNLAKALEAIDNCTRLRDKERDSVSAFLAKY